MVTLCNHPCYTDVVQKGDQSMPILHVRNVPEDLYEHIQRRAQLQHRVDQRRGSCLLHNPLEVSERPQARVLADIRRRRFYQPSDAGTPESVKLLREDRER